MLTFAKWLLEHRRAAEKTQREVAEFAGVDRAYITLLEAGGRHHKTGKQINPRPETIMSIAIAVGGDIDEALNLSGRRIRAKTFGFFLDKNQSIRLSVLYTAEHTPTDLLRIKTALITAYETAKLEIAGCQNRER